MKRLQASDIFEALALRPSDRVLDFGCGRGNLTAEMARSAGFALGIDTTSALLENRVDGVLAKQLGFARASGERLPFRAASFDVVLASEILPMVPDPAQFLREVWRVLRSDGRVVMVNGTGHPAIRRAYERQRPWFRLLLRASRKQLLDSYELYCGLLQRDFETARTSFSTPAELGSALEGADFKVVSVTGSPGDRAGAFVSWMQFFRVSRGRSPLTSRLFVPKFLIGILLNRVSAAPYAGGVICVAHKRQPSDDSCMADD